MMSTKGVWLLTIMLLLSTTIATATTHSLLPNPTLTEDTATNGHYTATYGLTLTSNTITFERDGITVGLQPHSLNFNNDLLQLQQINMPQNVERTQNGDTYEYPDAYGTGITLRYTNEWWGVKEEIIINQFSDLEPIAEYVLNGGNPYIEANFILTTNAGKLIVDGEEWDLSSDKITEQSIIVKDSNDKTLYYLPRPIATDNNGNTINGSYKLKKSAVTLFVSMTIPYSFLENAAYPVTIDPTFYVDYNPSPAEFYDSGDQEGEDYTTFNTPSDVTTTLSDGNTNTYAILSNSPVANDDVVKASFTHTYETGYTYFIRIYKNNIGTSNLTIYHHINDTNINNTTYETTDTTGIGLFYLDVTNQMIAMNNLSLNNSQFRLTSSSTIQLSELSLLQEQSDNITPTITNCQVDNNNATCNENISFSCIITDDTGLAYVTFSINDGGNNTYFPNKNNNLYTQTFANTGYNQITYTLTNVTACDLFNNCEYQTQNIIANYTCIDTCTPNWIAQYTDQSPCLTNNTKLSLLTYYDSESCNETTGIPSDNNTVVSLYCNYCDSDWLNLGTCLENNTILNDYYDMNNCYQTTNLSEDSPPIDDQTWTPCDYYENDFTCTISQEPYLKNKIEYTCQLPLGTTYNCINVISHSQDNSLQVNPQKQERGMGLISLRTDIESRESFTTSNGLLNAYFTDKNLLPDITFKITTTCNNENTTLSHEQSITPKIQDLNKTTHWLVWGKNNVAYIVIILLLLFLAAFIIGSLLREAKRK